MSTDSRPNSSATSTSERIDSPLMRSAGADVLSLALMDARNHTLHLYAQYPQVFEPHGLTPAEQGKANPPLWALGHVGWFQEWWIGRNMQRSLGPRCEPAPVRLASIEPQADSWWNPAHVTAPARWQLDLPPADHARAYLLGTLETTLDLLEKTLDTDEALYFYRLSLFHEDMASEALVQGAQTLGIRFDPALRATFTPPRVPARPPLLMPATLWPAGSAAQPGFAFDNEQPRHTLRVPEFEIDAQPVSWAQYVEFVDDGGYDRRELWQEAGWNWLQKLAATEGRRGPRYVDHISMVSGAVLQTRFGQPMRMHGDQPALHMSWWEADAWCRWAGRRLPAEVEWEVAAHAGGRRGFRWGDVWEWTASTFRPYPGFVPGPWRDYSEPHFDHARVLRGASFATRARMKHARHRHFQSAERDDVFCGFRSCAL